MENNHEEEAGEVEKVYVAVGSDVQDGYKTIDWVLKKWNSIPISIVILHTCNISKDFVYTPFGKLPASSVSEEKLQVVRKYEEQKIDKLLSKYIAFCGKVKAEILKVEKQDDQVQELIVDLISKLKITKLVMGITFMKSSSWKSRSAISGSFHIYQHKPEFCEFYIICGGKLVTLKRETDGVPTPRDRGNNLRSWIGKMFYEPGRNPDRSSANDGYPTDTENQWDKDSREIENYFQQLLTLNLDEEITEEEDGDLQTGSMEIDVPEHMSVGEKLEYLKSKIKEAHQTIELKREEAKANGERYAKAEWAISLCNSRIEELEGRIREESEKRAEIERTLDLEKEQLDEFTRDVEESKAKLSSLTELQQELSSKLQTLTSAKTQAEAQLENSVSKRGEMIREIEKLRHQRDLFNRRIEFCKEKDAIGLVSRLSGGEVRCGYREYSAEDVRLATDDFSERLRLKSGASRTSVYRGRINHTTVAVKMIRSDEYLSHEDFRAKVELLNEIRHPHLIAIVGFCSDPKCILFEYMHNGNLRDNLFTSQRNSRRRNRILKWHDRIRIAHQVCSGLGFLHSVKPKPFVHGHLTPAKILLDRNLVPRISGFGHTQHSDQSDTKPDIRAFGVLLLHLLTGRNWPGLLRAMTMNQTAVVKDLDEMAGKWPLELAKEVAALAMRCLSVNRGGNVDFGIEEIMEELDKMRKKAGELGIRGGYEEATNGALDEEDPNDVPSVFLCPIFQEAMKNPHVAADGFSYELEAIEEWLKMGHDTSPMTNLRLDHQFLTPNHTLRSLIQDWQSKRAALAST